VTRAVVFDLFETLVDYDDARSRAFSSLVARACRRDPDEFHPVWVAGRPLRDTGPMAPYLGSLGLEEDEIAQLIVARRDSTRGILTRPKAGAVEVLREVRARGVRTGLITVCSEDTPDVWPQTPFAGLFDAEVFSSSCGLSKPDSRIYELALSRLGVDPGEAIFVGDGANDELAGAKRVGMRAVQIWKRDDWDGERIDSFEELLDLL
jgi:putative hydrolase of the HAD superfamily